MEAVAHRLDRDVQDLLALVVPVAHRENVYEYVRTGTYSERP
jgi:hypothetical protein